MRAISSDQLLAMSQDEYHAVRRAATRARLDQSPRYVCGQCGYATYAPREGRTGQPYWKHHLGAPDDCPWWTGTPSRVDDVSARQFQGAQASKHCSMLVNVSRFVPVQRTVRDFVSEYVKRMSDAVKANYAMPEAISSGNQYMRSLRAAFDEQYSNAGVAWLEVKKALWSAFDQLRLYVVNSKTDDVLDFKRYEREGVGLTAIAVGGLNAAQILVSWPIREHPEPGERRRLLLEPSLPHPDGGLLTPPVGARLSRGPNARRSGSTSGPVASTPMRRRS